MNNSAPFSFRSAVQDDCASLAAISIEVWLGTYLRDGVNAFFADYALSQFTTNHFRTALNAQDDHIIVSQNTQGIDGFIRITHNAPVPVSTGSVSAGSNTEIATLYVQPRHHGKGIGQHLLSQGLAHIRQQGWSEPWLMTNAENTPALAFYHRMGFERTGHSHFRINDKQYLNTVLQYPRTRFDQAASIC